MVDAIEFTGLGHAYRPDHWVFRDYSASIPKGQVFALLGPNGRGKTSAACSLLMEPRH